MAYLLDDLLVAEERWSLTRGGRFTRGSKYSDLMVNLWYCGKLVAEERWSLTRGGRFTRGSKYSDLTVNLWYCGKLVAEERWSQPEVGLYSYFSPGFNRSVISIEHTARTYFAV